MKTKTIKTYDFEDIKGVAIPNKIKCPKCGKEIMGYPPLIQKRVYDQFGGSWKRYQKEWVCSHCKSENKKIIANKLDESRKQQKIEDAIKLLKGEGYKITKH